MKACSKPGCEGAGAAILSFDYSARLAFVDDPPDGSISPHVYVLCIDCADRLSAPLGWLLDDRRRPPLLFGSSNGMGDILAS